MTIERNVNCRAKAGVMALVIAGSSLAGPAAALAKGDDDIKLPPPESLIGDPSVETAPTDPDLAGAPSPQEAANAGLPDSAVPPDPPDTEPQAPAQAEPAAPPVGSPEPPATPAPAPVAPPPPPPAPEPAPPAAAPRPEATAPEGERDKPRHEQRGQGNHDATRTPAREREPVPLPRHSAAARPAPAASQPGDHSKGAKPTGVTYVVRSGDTLWAVAAELLGGDATDAQIAAEVRRLYRLNADVLSSPDALVPGQQLRLS